MNTLLEHRLVGDARGHALGDRELLREHHHAVGDDRQEDQGHLPFPADRAADRLADHPVVAHGDRQDAAEDQAAGPSGVQDVQPLGLGVREEGGDDRVDHRLDRPVAQGHDERADVEDPVAPDPHPLAQGLGEEEDQGGGQVADEGEGHRLAVADPVDDQAEQDDADGERPEPDAEDLALLGLGQAEVALPLVHDQGADDEGEGGGDQGDEAGPEEEEVARADLGGGGGFVRFVLAHAGGSLEARSRRGLGSSPAVVGRSGERPVPATGSGIEIRIGNVIPERAGTINRAAAPDAPNPPAARGDARRTDR
jgi:hypothetical protein